MKVRKKKSRGKTEKLREDSTGREAKITNGLLAGPPPASSHAHSTVLYCGG